MSVYNDKYVSTTVLDRRIEETHFLASEKVKMIIC